MLKLSKVGRNLVGEITMKKVLIALAAIVLLAGCKIEVPYIGKVPLLKGPYAKFNSANCPVARPEHYADLEKNYNDQKWSWAVFEFKKNYAQYAPDQKMTDAEAQACFDKVE